MIGMNLKYLRKKYGYSQEDLAERLEVSRQSVAKWGKRGISSRCRKMRDDGADF